LNYLGTKPQNSIGNNGRLTPLLHTESEILLPTVTNHQIGVGHVRSARNSLRPHCMTPNDGDYCSNHPGKTAKFRVCSEENDLFYCEKCAILLASQGFKVEKLMNPNISVLLPTNLSYCLSNSVFVQESEKFLCEIKHFLRESEKVKQNINEEKSRAQHYYSTFLDHIN
jgi:hypothetical protein